MVREMVEHDGFYQVLVVEDSLLFSELISRILTTLEKPKVEFKKAVSLKEIEEYFNRGIFFDLILLDLNLMDSLGETTLVKLKDFTEGKVPIIVLSGAEDEDIESRCAELGAQDFIPKDSLSEHLLSRSIIFTLERSRYQQQLLEREEFISSLLKASPQGLMALDDSGEVEFVNPSFKEMTGYSKGELIGHCFPFPWDSSDSCEALAYSTFIQKGGIRERKVLNKEGLELHIEESFHPVIQNGCVKGCLINWIDRTEQLRFQAIQESHFNFLETLIATIPSPIFYKDKKGKYLGCNKTCEEFFGVKSEEIVGKTVFDVFPQEIAEFFHSKDQELIRDEGIQTYEATALHQDGSSRNVIYYKTILRDQSGNNLGIVGVMIDITPLREKEKEISLLFTELETILKVSGTKLFIVDEDQSLVYVDPLTQRHFGPFDSKKCCDYFKGTADFCASCIFDTVEEGEGAKRSIMSFPGEDTSLYHLHCIPVPNIDKKTFYVNIFLDITKEDKAKRELLVYTRKLEESHRSLQQSQAQLIQSEKMASIGQLSAGVAHEINNPLGFVSSNLRTLQGYHGTLQTLMTTLIKGFSQSDEGNLNSLKKIKEEFQRTLEKEEIDYILEDLTTLLNESVEGLERINGIVQGLKSFSREDSQSSELIDINQCVETTLKVIWNELKYHCNVEKKLSEIPEIRAFPGQINQVILNLLINAGQAIKEKGKILISTSSDDKGIYLKISDSGEGIPDENFSKIFEPFFTTKPQGVGTGLGLSICYGIVQKHGGEIQFESKQGEGTSFTVFLPLEGLSDESVSADS